MICQNCKIESLNMCDQEFLQDDDSSINHLSTAAPEYTPTKRHSSSQFQEPLSKRATPFPPFSPPTAAAADYQLLGYTKLSLPHSFPPASPSPAPLRRTLSEPIYSPGTNKSSPPKAAAASTITPPRPPAGRNSSSFGVSRRTKRMKKIRERMKELWNQVSSEDGDEDQSDDHDEPDNNPKVEECGVENGSCSQEAVWVEKSGESLVLHFKCPCGNGYEVLLSGTSCYYKLSSF